MKQAMRFLVGWLIVELLPRTAQACSVCTAGRDDETNQAFLFSTLFLSVLPLAGLGTLVFVLWRRIRALEAADASGRPNASASAMGTELEATPPGVLTPPSPAH